MSVFNIYLLEVLSTLRTIALFAIGASSISTLVSYLLLCLESDCNNTLEEKEQIKIYFKRTKISTIILIVSTIIFVLLPNEKVINLLM